MPPRPVSADEVTAGIYKAATSIRGASYLPIGENGQPTTGTAGVAFPGNDWLGLAYRVQHRDVDSVDEFRQALALSPSSLNIKLELAISMGVLKDCSGAMPILQEVIKADPHSTEANEVLGECLVEGIAVLPRKRNGTCECSHLRLHAKNGQG